MGLIDKLKNALFEVEYVEVEEPVKKEKKVKKKVQEIPEKPIAKKIVLPGKRDEKIEEIKEEELKDDNFEVRPKDEAVKSNRDEFKFMDDNDFKVEDESYVPDEPEILEVLDKTSDKIPARREKRQSREEQRVNDSFAEKVEVDKDFSYNSNDNDKYYNKTGRAVYSGSRESKPYGVDSSLSVPMHEYGTYERKEDKPYFKPSPIISPIYGILDKNYKKEDVVQKKEIRLTTGFSRSNVSVDDIRNKAYGSDKHAPIVDNDSTFEVEEDEDDNLLVDLSDDKEKPEVKDLTMGDALEYFQDLGLEYNVDYVDVSKNRTTPRRAKDSYQDEAVEVSSDSVDDSLDGGSDESLVLEKDVVKVKTDDKVTKKSESKTTIEDDDDNLFDLIDSMYQDNE